MSDKIKTLSQAIGLGATFRPQSYAATFGLLDGVTELGSCALGAAYEAIGGECKRTRTWEAIKALKERFGFGICDEIFEEVMYRNDGLKHTREQIADWLEAQGL